MHSDAASQGSGWWQGCGAAYVRRAEADDELGGVLFGGKPEFMSAADADSGADNAMSADQMAQAGYDPAAYADGGAAAGGLLNDRDVSLSNIKNLLTIRLSKVIPSRLMANTKSAIKRIRRITKQTVVNKARKSRYKNALKRMNLLIDEKKKLEALKFLPKLNSELMKIAKTGIIKKQNASRNVSRITKKINSL